ncbi:MAG: hypothetical protein HYU02_05900 [Thaumarchaeota archaeon]|nr:hypothetical protein [Nitrososphaerota archaeon]
MCTIIAIANPNPEYKFFFFANRDRPLDHFYGNYLKFFKKNKVLGIYDVRSDSLASGYSLQSGIYGGIANVGDYKGKKSRGVLLKKVLTNVNNLLDAVIMMERELLGGEYSSASYLIGKDGENWLFENSGRNVYSERLGERFVLTNYFTGIKGKVSEEAKARRNYVAAHLGSKVEINDILKIVAHHGEKDGICRHGITLASLFVAGRKKGKPLVLYGIGESCQGLHNVIEVVPEISVAPSH